MRGVFPPPQLTETAHAAARRLVERGETLAVCESSAGGLISASLLSFPGASAFYLGGTVIYTLAGTKAQFDGGSIPFPEKPRSASEGWATYLATAVGDRLGAGWALAETGASGPRGNPYGDPAGHTWVACLGPGGVTATRNLLTGSDDRGANMVAFAAAALSLLLEQLA